MAKFLVLLFLLSFEVSWASWRLPHIEAPDLKLNNLRFTNRSRCALDSEKPTESAFIIVNNTDVGKGIYRLARATGHNTSEMTKEGIGRFRVSVLEMAQLIHHHLMTQKLPLLPADATKEFVPKIYKRIMEQCRSDQYCYALDDYLASLWANKGTKIVQSLDHFTKESFIPKEVFYKKQFSHKFSCHRLKKFGPLQAHLYGTKPTLQAFEQIAKTSIQRDEYLDDCYKEELEGDLKSAAYQIEINHLRTNRFWRSETWVKYGFDYWNSFKLYFSWAWRNAPELESMAGVYHTLFRSVPIEESVLLVPNGCRSLAPAKCQGSYLSLQSLREFTKDSFASTANNNDLLAHLPSGPGEHILDDVFTEVNTDILDLASFDQSSDWVNNFQDNFSNSRLVMRRKLLKSVSLFNVLTKKLTPNKILQDVEKTFQKAASLKKDALELQQLYYLCSEYNYAFHEDFSFIRGDLSILKKTNLVAGLGSHISDLKMQDIFSYYEQIAQGVLSYCKSLNQKEIWSGPFQLERKGYNSWYVQKVLDNKIKSQYTPLLKDWHDVSNEKPLLSWKGVKNFENTICLNGSHCAREVLAKIVDLYAVAQYAQTFWTIGQKLKDPNLFNPYAERTACKVYDPWYRTKSVIFNVITDLSQAALGVFTPGVLYTRLDLQPGKVTSFKKMIKDGQIEYDPQYEPSKINAALVADFGPLVSVPCSVSISGTPYLNGTVYRFGGITVEACHEQNQHVLTATSGSDISSGKPQSSNACFSCSLNFESVAASAASALPTSGAYHLVRSFFRFIQGLGDPHNIPRDWEANVNDVTNTYRSFGRIPKHCVRPLSRGEHCLKHTCDGPVVDKLRKTLKGGVQNITYRRSRAYVKMTGCREHITLQTYLDQNDDRQKDSCRTGTKVTVPGACRSLIRGDK